VFAKKAEKKDKQAIEHTVSQMVESDFLLSGLERYKQTFFL